METFLNILILCVMLSPIYFIYRKFYSPEGQKKLAEYKEKQAEQERVSTPFDLLSDNGACPKCECKEWKLASLVHAEGLSIISTSTIGVGAGADNDLLGGGVGIGAGVGKTKGDQQTMLSEIYLMDHKLFVKQHTLPPSQYLARLVRFCNEGACLTLGSQACL